MSPKTLVTVRLPETVLLEIMDKANSMKKPKSECHLEFIADGMRWDMCHNHSKPISPAFLQSLSTEGVFSFRREFSDAVCSEISGKRKLLGPHGNTHRFVQVPENSQYHSTLDGKPVYLVLGPAEMIGPDGEIWVKK